MKTKVVISMLLILPLAIGAKSLTELVCKKHPKTCDPAFAQHLPFQVSPNSSNFHQSIRLPTEFPSWKKYGRTQDDGTGSEVGSGYRLGLGDIAVRTGIGVQFPYGNFGFRRDLEVGFGGSGRIGGVPVGFGNGYSKNGADTDLTGWPHSRPFTNGDFWPRG